MFRIGRFYFAGLLMSAALFWLVGCSDNGAEDNRETAARQSNDAAPVGMAATRNETAPTNQSSNAAAPEEIAIASHLPDIPGDTIYRCDPSMTVSTRFAAQQDSSEESAGDDALIVMVNGKAHRAELVPSASGAKYQATGGLTWWTKGKDGTLSDAKGATITTCTERT